MRKKIPLFTSFYLTQYIFLMLRQMYGDNILVKYGGKNTYMYTYLKYEERRRGVEGKEKSNGGHIRRIRSNKTKGNQT